MTDISEIESPGDNRGDSTGTTGNRSTSEKIAARRAGRLATTPDRFKGHFIAAWSSSCSPRRAVKAFCLECQGFDVPGIADCTGWACPLWHFRPFQKP